MKKTYALESLEWLSACRLPCSLTHWREAVIENPNFMQEDYDHIVKYSAIPEEVHKAYLDELMGSLKPLEEALWNMAPSKGILYMVQHPEYQQEWEVNCNKREAVRALQHPERMRIHKRLHRKYYHEYGIRFNSKIVD